MTNRHPGGGRPGRLLGALCGVLAAAAAIGAGELVSLLTRPQAAPLIAVGGALIDGAPQPVEQFVIAVFGEADRIVLLAAISAALALFAAVIGVLARLRIWAGLLGVVVFGAIGVTAALSRPEAAPADALPSLAGTAAAGLVLVVLTRLSGGGPDLSAWPAAPPPPARRATAPVPETRAEEAPSGGARATARSRGPGRDPHTVRPDGGAAGGTDAPSDPGPVPASERAASGPDATRPEGRAASGVASGSSSASGPEQVASADGLDGAGPHGVTAGAEPGAAPGSGGASGDSEAPERGDARPEPPHAGLPPVMRAGGPGAAAAFDRRRFVLAATATAVLSAGAAATGIAVGAARSEAGASRSAIRLPAPASPAGPVPAGADLGVPGVEPFTTPSEDFYRVDTALVVPQLNAMRWRLRLHGQGVRERSYTYADLLAHPGLVERDVTLACVSNPVGGPYVGNARWIGVPLGALLREAGVRPPSEGGRADQLVSRSSDGMTIGTPVEDVMDGRDAMLAIGMNGRPLPVEHGFPVRMVVPGLYGYVSACKWLVDLELTTFDAFDAYWVPRGWAARGPIKTQSRIDTPRPGSGIPPGRVPIAGVAWAQTRGITAVEVRVDGGPWRPARLAAEDSADTWRQWVLDWDAAPGEHTIQVRATDGDGTVQTEREAPPAPDGASGWHTIDVTVG
ncbi:molybdopterin-dependent oxidoreductase [Allonocardiopsis opalescens]|uniref:DMSO/TMAO reductase YedYZ molybdopterin-dependent catalytic subunit n=1 Tax=Allonocardiopsis opalescens TaxID=1144618 RepID=A0A2T0QE40_9ACTN|nr:molybdopterin-dependent oxidoreductase [Allonocardiopsis opalescens]PRY02189.1 DMSO/TMAO reductase YedYZ molybdopterin-dependent catalytic subunit [Allonocardiopsis opalescens]